MMSSANEVQDQDPIPGTVFGPIAFPEPEIIPITTDVIQVTTGHDWGISGRTISNTTTENITQPDVTSNCSVASELTTSTISVGNTTLTPAVVTTEPLAKSVPDLTDNQMTQPQISGTVVTSDVTTPIPALTVNIALACPVVPETEINQPQCVVKLHRLKSTDIAKYTNVSTHVKPVKENITSTQSSCDPPDEQYQMTLHTRSNRTSKHPSQKANLPPSTTPIWMFTVRIVRLKEKRNYQKRNQMSQGQTVKSEPSSSEQNDEEVHPPPPNQDDPAYQADNECDTADDTGTKGKGKLVTTQHGIIKRPKRVRKFKCKICNNVFNSMKEWNKHYEENHPLLPCLDCGKMFCNPRSLYHHRYTHTKTMAIFPCTKCDRVFPFISQLESHMFTHRKVKHFPCTASGCQKVFKTE